MDIKDLLWAWEIGKILIEKVSNAIWLWFEPIQIKRVSKAHAEANVESEKIRMLWRLENLQKLSEYQERGLLRRLHEDWIQQENLEKILLWAPQFLWKDAKPQDLDDDWLRNFSEKAKMTSDEEMQKIWSRILAWEWTEPWSLSKKTVNIVHDLEKKDAELFTKLCSFCIGINWILYPFVRNKDDSIYSDNGLTFDNLSHLESLWLIQFNWVASYILNGSNNSLDITYWLEKWTIKSNSEKISIIQGTSQFTQIWRDLSKIVSPKIIPWFPDYMKKHFLEDGFTIN